MKIFRVIAILSLLVIFPAISYVYLTKGYNFRKEALDQLAPKMELKSLAFSNLAVKDLSSKVTLLYDNSISDIHSFVDPIYEEFSHNQEFQMVGFDTDTLNHEYKTRQSWFTSDVYPYDKDIALVDTAGVIRNYYSADSASVKLLIQHLPIVIPRKKEKDIILKRDDEK